MMIKKYRKKPLAIEAVKFTDENFDTIVDWLSRETQWFNEKNMPTGDLLYIETLEGVMRLKRGDYLLRGVHGEFYPCDAKVFEETYIPAVEWEKWFLSVVQ